MSLQAVCIENEAELGGRHKIILIKLMITIEYNKSDKYNISVFKNKTGMWLVYYITNQCKIPQILT